MSTSHSGILFTHLEPLDADEVWTSPTRRVDGYRSIIVAVKSDAAGTYQVQFSVDGTNWDSTLTYTYTPGETFAPHQLQIARRYCRVVYTNGSVAQTYMRLQASAGDRGPLTLNLNGRIEKEADALTVRAISDEIAIAAGLYRGYSIVNKFGRNTDVDTGPEDVIIAGGTYAGFPIDPTAETLEILSTDTDDTDGGSGAQTIQVYGLDANWEEQNEIVTMNGTAGVTTSGTYVRCHRAVVRSAGASGGNEGTITVRHSSTTANIFATIDPGFNQTLQAVYTTPANTTAYVRHVIITLVRESGGTFNREAVVSLRVREFGEVFAAKAVYGISSSTLLDREIFGGISVPEKSDIKLVVESVTTANSQIDGAFDLVLERA